MKRYWLTPLDLDKRIRDRIGDYFDPCPYPRSAIDGLETPWLKPWYCNPPYLTKDGGGVNKWIKKALLEGGPGVMVLPTLSNIEMLLKHHVELEYCPRVRWLDVDTLEPCKNPVPVLMAVFR